MRFPWRDGILITTGASLGVFADGPLRVVSVVTLAILAAAFAIQAAAGSNLFEEYASLARAAAIMRGHIDGFVTQIAAAAADAVAVVREYDDDEADRLEAAVGDAFRTWDTDDD